MVVDTSYQNVALGITVAFSALGGVAVILRFWSRKLSNSRILIEDWLILAAYILVIAETATSWHYIKTNYIGIHVYDIPVDRDTRIAHVWDYANQLLYNPILSMVKISVLIFLLRLDSRSRVIYIITWSTIWFTLLLAIAVLLTDLFQCHPVSYVYDKTIVGGTCINQGAFYVATAVLTIFTDLLVLVIPMLITYSLQMPIRRKIAVICILSLGGVATAIGCWRLTQLIQAFFPSSVNPDPTYTIGFSSSAIEVNTAVIAACAPSMKAIFNRFLPRFLGTSKRGGGGGTSSGYGKSGTGNRYIHHNHHHHHHHHHHPNYHRGSGLGYSRSVASNPAPDDAYELGQQYRHHTHTHTHDHQSNVIDITGPGDKGPRIKTQSPSISSDEDIAGIMASTGIGIGIVKTTNVEVTEETRDRDHSIGGGNHHNNKASSLDSLV